MVIDILKSLVSGQETYESWTTYCHKHHQDMIQELGEDEYLKLRPLDQVFESLTLLTSQRAAAKYLEANNYTITYSFAYEDAYTKDFENYIKNDEKRVEDES